MYVVHCTVLYCHCYLQHITFSTMVSTAHDIQYSGIQEKTQAVPPTPLPFPPKPSHFLLKTFITP